MSGHQLIFGRTIGTFEYRHPFHAFPRLRRAIAAANSIAPLRAVSVRIMLLMYSPLLMPMQKASDLSSESGSRTALFAAFVGNIFHFMIHAAPRHRRICSYSSGRVAPFGSCSGTRIAFWWLSASHPSLFASTMKLCLSFLMAMRYFFGRWRRTFSRSGLFPRDQLP